VLESYRRTSTLLRAAAGAVVATVAMGASVGTALASTGSWAIVPAPSPDAHSALYDVACVGSSDCWAVGTAGYTNQALIEHDTGSGWVIAPTPPLYSQGALNGVTCVTASNCWAVGSYLDSGSGAPNTALFEHYDGSSWTQVSSLAPHVVPVQNVACVTASNCWAVAGDSIEQYTGTSWVLVSNLGQAVVNDVTCIGVANVCWIVGEDETGGALIESNTGSGWVVVPNDVPTTSLTSVTCASATNCWAVGHPLATQGAVTEHYDGINWTVVPTPRSSNARLLDVACVGASDCWAVGYRRDAGRPITYHTLIEHHLSSGWVIVSNPTDDTSLSGVTCVSSHDCWAVGGAPEVNNSLNLLVEQYTS
jgi:hypothetical protein